MNDKEIRLRNIVKEFETMARNIVPADNTPVTGSDFQKLITLLSHTQDDLISILLSK